MICTAHRILFEGVGEGGEACVLPLNCHYTDRTAVHTENHCYCCSIGTVCVS